MKKFPADRNYEWGKSIRTGEPMVPVLYLDLDGTVRKGFDELGRFVNTAQDVEVFEEVPNILATYKKLGWKIVGISNQGGIALGYMSMQTCAAAMAETQKQCNGLFDKIAWCSHHPQAAEPEMAVCWCRKPRIGLIVESALDLSDKTGEIYPPHLGVFVGDMDTDQMCAENAGLHYIPADRWRRGVHLEMILPRL